MPLHGEGTVSGDEALQLRFINTLEQLFKGGGLEVRQDDQHPLAGAQADIGLGKGALVPGKQHPAVFHPDILNVQPPQFVSCQALQAKQAGNGKFHFFHRFSHFLVNSAIYGMILLFFKYRSSSEKTQPQYF